LWWASGDKVIPLWCEPQIINGNEEKTSYEHFVKAEDANPYKLWMKLFNKLFPHLKQSPDTNDYLPSTFIVKVTKKNDQYEVLEILNQKLKNFNKFENVIFYMENIINYFETLIEVENLNSNLSISDNSRLIINSIVENTYRYRSQNKKEVEISDLYPDLRSFISDLVDNVDITKIV